MRYQVKKLCHIPLAVFVASIAACQQVPTRSDESKPNEYTRVTSDTVSTLFDKKLTLDANFFVVSSDGSFSGNWNSAPMAGTWEFENDYFCRTLTVFFKSENTGTMDCQLWEIKNDKVRGTRNKGKGTSFTYEIK